MRYFLSRLRAGEGDDADADRPVTMMARSFSAYQARKNGQDVEFNAKLETLKAALAAEADVAEAATLKIAAFSGMQVEPLVALAARIEAEIDALPTTIVEWCDWLVDFLIQDRGSYALLFGGDVETVKAVTRGKKTGGNSTQEELERLKPALRAWLSGQPFAQIEQDLGVPVANLGCCKRARDFALRLMNRRFYLIVGALTPLVQHLLAEHDKAVASPAAVEVLAIAVRNPAFERNSSSASTSALVGSSRQSSRRKTVKGRITEP